MMESHNFLGELWQRRAEEERGETQEDRDLNLYRRFEIDGQKYPSLTPIINELQSTIGKYAEAVTRLSLVKIGKLDKDTIVSADRHRHLIHNNLIDVVNHLSREYKNLKIDNDWRSAIIGESREEIGDWALTVARKELNHEEVM
ncbi:MAG: hypothetical protein NUV78_03005 [Candidatus Zambryskibacteria bacterium]|nr:hypothetical protein [Candidatus Zambryskibacteria bacterium]